eukprot:CAMPEP_0197536392 /NCGR_PEP_ID=MMETSP1318-20131121/53762_1 /TAXON_ID=552666 /ORGANISM="Partenskyella glossopodia, Strain RCC365" /LENGTH=156 /DNA_ID=CAMNT_0043094269 /DNA_START=79 /DNA_END=549 /DNA_ORIENTATION=-
MKIVPAALLALLGLLAFVQYNSHSSIALRLSPSALKATGSSTRFGRATTHFAAIPSRSTFTNRDLGMARRCAETSEEKEEVRKPGQPDKDGFVYADEMTQPARKRPTMSMEQKKKLRDEYVGIGGGENTSMPNYFLSISIFIALLSILVKALGYLD